MGLFKAKKMTAACIGLLMTASFVSADFLLDDFDDGNGESNLNSYWYFYTDAGNSGTSTVAGVAQDPPFAGSYEGKDGTYGVQMDFTLGDSTGMSTGVKPYVAFETEFVKGGTIDFSGVKSVKFYIKASSASIKQVQFCVPTKEVTNYNFYQRKIDVTTSWTPVEILFTKDLTAGLNQESWGADTKPVAFDSAAVQKFLFKVRANENPGLKTGVLSIDSIVLVGNPSKLKKYAQVDTVPVHSYTGQGLLSNFEGEVPTANTLNLSWYNYDDQGITGTSKFTKGLFEGSLIADETGGNPGGGLSMAFVLGDKITDASNNKIAPFVGVGTELGRGTDTYDAAGWGATGIYVDYKSDKVFIDVEVEDNNKRPGGVVYFAKLPPTGGEWRGASINWTDLKLTSWAKQSEVKALDFTNLTKINFKISDEAIKEGTFALDNVYLMGALIKQGVVSPVKKFSSNGITFTQTNSILTVNFTGKAIEGNSRINLCNQLGKVVASRTVTAGHSTCSFPLINNANGVYILNVIKSNGITETTPIHIFR